MEPKNKEGKINWPLFLTLSAVAAVCLLLWSLPRIAGGASVILTALKPLFIGMALAYVLCPLAKRLEKLLQGKKPRKFVRPLSVLLTVLLLLALLVLFCALVLPQLSESVGSLVAELPELLEEQLAKLEARFSEDNEAAASFMESVESLENSVVDWIKSNLFSAVTQVAGKVKEIGSALVSLAVAAVVMIYLLLDRERYMAQCKKLFLSVSKNERFNAAVFDALHQSDRIFSGFISGKLLDSLVVGILCFLFMLVAKMPYAALISVIVGVTNVIPMFGPFLGAIPSAFLLLLISPRQCLIFLIFIVILQQLDGNVIGPRILGNSTGISALYVTIAILVFGKLWGFLGMLVGVPLFATLYYIVKRLAEQSLQKQGLPIETEKYR